MTEPQSGTGAPSGHVTHWHSIDWANCYREVRRLQARIVKATQAGKHGKVKALQWLLTHSFSGKALAVRRVTENQGKRTPGVDNITWSTPMSKLKAVSSLKRRGYQPRPLRRIYIPKANGKLRPLGIPTMKDRAMQALHLLALEPVAESTADPNSYGFRRTRSTADAIEQCFTVLSKKGSARWVLEADIRSCFDEIAHEWLIAHIPTDKAVLQKWLKAGYLDNQVLHSTEAGTPQGGIISPTLMNMTLDGLESMLRRKYSSTRQRSAKVNIIRYADDFVVTGATQDVLDTEVRPMVEHFLAERGLSLSAEKTRTVHIDDGFDFLGMTIRRYGSKLLTKPAKVSVLRLVRKVREIVKGNATVRHEQLIRYLNPLLRGWATYYQHVVSKRVFSSISCAVWQYLWRWAKRRHPNKGARWVKRKYFRSVGARHWVFGTEVRKRSSTEAKELLALYDIAGTPIRRHRKIKGAANPFDPQWEGYFEERLGFAMLDSLKGRKRLIRLWLDQGRSCPICSQLITKTNGWRLHHLVRKVDGGGDSISNLVMLHPGCQQIARTRGFSVVKPVYGDGL